MSAHTTTTNRESLIEMFLDQTAGEVYWKGRLYTRESPDGDGVQLVAYGNHILAEIDGRDLTFYVGHHAQVSETLTGYVKLFGSILSDGGYSHLSIDVRSEAPTVGYDNASLNAKAAQFISNYVGDYTEEFSAVEQDAIDTVENALGIILDREFNSAEAPA